MTLTAGRPQGFGPSPIPLQEIESYCRVFGVADVDEFVCLIREMDAEYLTWARSKNG